jgi:hypothetical protein
LEQFSIWGYASTEMLNTPDLDKTPIGFSIDVNIIFFTFHETRNISQTETEMLRLRKPAPKKLVITCCQLTKINF